MSALNRIKIFTDTDEMRISCLRNPSEGTPPDRTAHLKTKLADPYVAIRISQPAIPYSAALRYWASSHCFCWAIVRLLLSSSTASSALRRGDVARCESI